MRTLAMAWALALLADPAVAAADMADPVLEPCPIGARWSAGHGRACVAFRCESQAVCDRAETRPEPRDDLVCRSVGTCQETRVIHHRSGWRTGSSEEMTFGFGPCDVDGSCEQGTCVTEPVCVPEAFDPADPHRALPTGCGCAHGSGGAALSVVLLGPLALLAGRRRRPGVTR